MSAPRIGLLILTALLLPGTAPARVTHELIMTLDPAAQRLEVTDTVTPVAGSRRVEFSLHAGLAPRIVQPGATLARIGEVPARSGTPLERYAVTLADGAERFTVRYRGRIHHPVDRSRAGYSRGFGVTPGLIGTGGVYLGPASHWYPVVDDAPVTWSLTVALPPGWRAMTQGRRTARDEDAAGARESWQVDAPQEHIFLIAGAFTEYTRPAGAVEAQVLLREPAPALAARYLEATGRYVEMYRRLIGPYPYGKFALVENFWETGYGMPSFTLLGPRVIRLPFILHSSYPHEILHNWWGNGVYVDYASGNWAEGLTTYLADHLVKEQRGQGAQYRRATLQKYADYVRGKRDFPLAAFRGRHGSVSEAVGYGKTLMLFHMLRRRLGDQRFTDGLRRLYRDHRFRVAGFDDVRASFAAAAGEPLDGFFRQWVERAGAPTLRLADVSVSQDGNRFRLRAALEQVHGGAPYALRVPLAVHLEGQAAAHQQVVAMEERRAAIDLVLPARPLRLDVDPEFDVFRRLDRAEIPPAISQVLGDPRVTVVLPAAAPETLRRAYEALVASWRRGRAGDWQVVDDEAIGSLPEDRSVWLFGWENRFRGEVEAALGDYAFRAGEDGVEVEGTRLARNADAVVAVGRNPRRPQHGVAWVAADNARAIPGLARKLPHYGKYGYLGFRGDQPRNVAKGQWPVLASPMSVALTDDAGGAGKLAVRAPLIEPPAAYDPDRMIADVRTLADPALAGRGLATPALERAAAHIEARFRELGLEPAGDAPGSYRQTWDEDVGAPLGQVTLSNLVAVLPGSEPRWSGQSVVLGAHYDHLGLGWPDVRAGDEGRVHPGADDNASGVAVMLELARVLKSRGLPRRSVVFVAFSGEEAGRLGSRHYLRAARRFPRDGIMGMINLDSVGRLEGRALLVLGAASAREWEHIFRGAGYVAGVPVKSVTRELDASDQVSFIEAGVPAVQLFTGPHGDYHRPSDTASKIDAAGMVRVAAVADEAVSYLAGRPDPLNAVARHTSARGSATGPRRVSLGTVPDFAHPGPGVRIEDVTEASPAAWAGLRGGDIIVGLGETPVADLRSYADALRALSPGQAITVRFLRDGVERSVDARVVAR